VEHLAQHPEAAFPSHHRHPWRSHAVDDLEEPIPHIPGIRMLIAVHHDALGVLAVVADFRIGQERQVLLMCSGWFSPAITITGCPSIKASFSERILFSSLESASVSGSRRPCSGPEGTLPVSGPAWRRPRPWRWKRGRHRPLQRIAHVDDDLSDALQLRALEFDQGFPLGLAHQLDQAGQVGLRLVRKVSIMW